MERIQQERYDIAVVGGGAAGCMAAIQASFHGKKVVLLERKLDIGRKILLTGNGRCNLTNKSPLPVFLEKFGRRGSFFRSAFSSFSSDDLIDFFEKAGLKLKKEDNGRIFPITNRSQSVIDVLLAQMKKHQVTVIYNYRVGEIRKVDGYFQLSKKTSAKVKENKQNLNSDHSSEPYFTSTYEPIRASRVIIATGGASYPQTGSTGDGYHLAHQLGHEILPLKPGLVPLRIKESWARSWQGVVLKEVVLIFRHGKKGKIMGEGDVLFTHFGVSGPILLDLSQEVVKILDEEGEVRLFLDLMPTATREQLEEILLDDFKKHSKRDLHNYLRRYLPSGFIKTFLKVLDIDPHKKLNQVDRKQRIKLVDNIKGFKLTVNGHLPLSKAMITCGGVSRNEIDPESMESRLVPGLYLAGEVIAGCAASGGYNLQQAFSTGFLSAISASESISCEKK